MYRYLSFDGVALPTNKPIDDLSSAMSESAMVAALNGNVDVLGATQVTHKPQTLEYSGLYLSLDGLLIDHAGDYLITEAGDNLWTGSEMAVTIDGWRRRRGVRGVLVRQRDGDGALHWKYARLSYFEAKRDVVHADAILPMRFVFELADGPWREMTENSVSQALTANATTNVAVTIAGSEVVSDAVIEITASSYIYGIDILVGSDQKLQWAYASPPVFPTKTIIFDCGRFTVTEDGATRYVGFNLGTTHTIQDWIQLSPGSNTIQVVLNGGGGTALVRFYNQYP